MLQEAREMHRAFHVGLLDHGAARQQRDPGRARFQRAGRIVEGGRAGADHRQVVFTIVNGHAKAVAVTTGFNTDGFTEILAADEPLAGLNLVVAGQAFLNDGDPVIATVTKTENTPGIRREKLKAQP